MFICWTWPHAPTHPSSWLHSCWKIPTIERIFSANITTQIEVQMCTFAALMSSSERHSAMDLMFLKAASLAPVQSSQIAWRGKSQRSFIWIIKVTDEREHWHFRVKKCLHHLLSNNVGNKTSLSWLKLSPLSDHQPGWLSWEETHQQPDASQFLLFQCESSPRGVQSWWWRSPQPLILSIT